jgi:hypothetical protein
MKIETITTHILISIALSILTFSACKQAEPLLYDRDANIYFDLPAAQKDSIVYTFSYNMNKASDTIYIPVSLSGIREPKERFYSAYVEQDSSTAVEDVHFEKLALEYKLDVGAGKTFLPLVIYNVPDLEENSVSLIIKLKESADFNIENPKIIKAKIVFSARLEQPIWWSMWLQDYSRTKHQLFIIATDQTTLTTEGLDAPKNLYFADMLRAMLNNPFQWVDRNPQKGYELSTKDNGATYDFYHKDNPGRTITLKKNVGSGQYQFIDELGREVR